MSIPHEALPGKGPTLQEIADAAGVTISTVSKALNGQGKLRKETRQRVFAEAKRLGFRQKGQVLNEIKTIAMVTTAFTPRFCLPFWDGLEEAGALYDQPVSFILCRARDQEQVQQHVINLQSKHIDGIIFFFDNVNLLSLEQVEQLSVPYLYAYTQMIGPSELCYLPDNIQGAQLATEHLLQVGCRHIAHITGPLYYEAVHLRAKGMRQVLQQHNVPFSPLDILSGPWSPQWGYEATQQLLDREQNIDGIFCGNDEIAVGVIQALQERGRRVPEDVAIIGFDNWSDMVYRVQPHITSIDMNLGEIGRLAGTQLLALIEGKDLPRQPIYIPCTLVQRASTSR